MLHGELNAKELPERWNAPCSSKYLGVGPCLQRRSRRPAETSHW
ncbi:MAG: hypothetical protein ACLTSG_12110 [Lachnospiraceae bacterium]